MENPIKLDDLGVPLFSETPNYELLNSAVKFKHWIRHEYGSWTPKSAGFFFRENSPKFCGQSIAIHSHQPFQYKTLIKPLWSSQILFKAKKVNLLNNDLLQFISGVDVL